MSQVRRSSRKTPPRPVLTSVNELVERSGLGSQDSGSKAAQVAQVDYSQLSAGEIMRAILERNKDPEIERMVVALISKIPSEISETMEAEKRARSIVIHNLEEASVDLPPSSKQRDLEDKVSSVLDVLGVECRPVEVYRMGQMGNDRPRLVKIVLPSRAHWRRALANSFRLRESVFSDVYIRRSMTAAEREKEKDLRNEASERNKQAKNREWVVFRGELRRIQDLPVRRAGSSGNA